MWICIRVYGCAGNASGIAQLVKVWISIYDSSLTAGRVVFLVWAFSKPFLQIASVGPDHCDKKNGGPNHSIRVKINPLLLKIHLPLLKKSKVSAGDM